VSSATSFETQVVGATLVIRVAGYLNSRLGVEVGRAVDEMLDAGGRNVLLNFGAIKMLNSVGIASISTIVQRMSDLQGHAAFCSLAGMNREIFATMGATRGVELFDSEPEALAWFDANG
jgi:anti-anti-sigma factor